MQPIIENGLVNMYIFRGSGRFAESVSPNSISPKPFRRTDVSPNGRFAEWTFRRKDVSPNGRFTEWTFRRKDVSPNGRFTERTFHRMDVSPNPFHRKEILVRVIIM